MLAAHRVVEAVTAASEVRRTDRLRMRMFDESDVDLLVELDSDPEVMRYLTGGTPTPREDIANRVLPAILACHRRPDGLGVWAAELLATGEFVGWFELCPRRTDPPGSAELGYRLRRAHWGGGLGTEGSLALVRAAFTEFGLDRVYAQTMAVNAGSLRVMAKAGLRYVRTFDAGFDDPIPGTEDGEVEYEITRADWES